MLFYQEVGDFLWALYELTGWKAFFLLDKWVFYPLRYFKGQYIHYPINVYLKIPFLKFFYNEGGDILIGTLLTLALLSWIKKKFFEKIKEISE